MVRYPLHSVRYGVVIDVRILRILKDRTMLTATFCVAVIYRPIPRRFRSVWQQREWSSPPCQLGGSPESLWTKPYSCRGCRSWRICWFRLYVPPGRASSVIPFFFASSPAAVFCVSSAVLSSECWLLVDFDLFLRILNRPDGFRAPGQPDDFVRGFQVFDKDGTGFIGVGELKYGTYASSHSACDWLLTIHLVLTSLGEKLSEGEVEELLKGVNIGKDGSINYTGNLPLQLQLTGIEFVQMILANW